MEHGKYVTRRQRCLWCAYPVDLSDGKLEIALAPYQGQWCMPHCAVSYFKTFRRELKAERYIRVLQECTHTPFDAEWTCAPEPQPYEWWTPGGLPRGEFLLKCRMITMTRHDAEARTTLQITPNYGLRELFQATTPPRGEQPSPKRLRIGTPKPQVRQNQNTSHRKGNK